MNEMPDARVEKLEAPACGRLLLVDRSMKTSLRLNKRRWISAFRKKKRQHPLCSQSAATIRRPIKVMNEC